MYIVHDFTSDSTLKDYYCLKTFSLQVMVNYASGIRCVITLIHKKEQSLSSNGSDQVFRVWLQIAVSAALLLCHRHKPLNTISGSFTERSKDKAVGPETKVSLFEIRNKNVRRICPNFSRRSDALFSWKNLGFIVNDNRNHGA